MEKWKIIQETALTPASLGDVPLDALWRMRSVGSWHAPTVRFSCASISGHAAPRGATWAEVDSVSTKLESLEWDQGEVFWEKWEKEK